MHQRRQSPHHDNYWVMVIDGKYDDNSVVAIRYHPMKLCLDNAATDRFMESISQEFIVRPLPLFMDGVLDAISGKKINCSSSREILLNYPGQLSTSLSEDQLRAKFDGEECFFLHCIQVATHGYICRALTNINSMIDEKEQLPFSLDQCRSLFSACKAKAADQQVKHQYKEKYLKPLFSTKLRRSLDEFMMIVIKAFGFCPYKFEDDRPALSPM